MSDLDTTKIVGLTQVAAKFYKAVQSLDDALPGVVPYEVRVLARKFVTVPSSWDFWWECSYCGGLREGLRCGGCGAPRQR